MTPRRLTCVAGGLHHSYLLWGLGGARPLVLLHGFLDQGWGFARLVEALAAGGLGGYTVVAPDLRGHGHSGHVGAGGAYHFPDYLRDVVGLLDHLEAAHGLAGPVDLLGHSMGGSIAGYLAGAFPERVARLVLVEGLGPPSEDAAAGPEKLRAFVERSGALAGRAPRILPSVAAAADRLQAGDHRLSRDLALALAREGTRPVATGGVTWRFDPRHRAPSAIPFHFSRLEAFLRRLACPVQLVDGAESGKLPDHAARGAVIPGARHAVIPGAGHMVHQDRPEALAAVVAGFLAATPPGAPPRL